AAKKTALTKSMPPQVTEPNILGPYYRQGAPYRGKSTPPLEPGEVIVIRGQVWGHDSKRPLAHAVLDIWQANAKGRYDNDDPHKQARTPPSFESIPCPSPAFWSSKTTQPSARELSMRWASTVMPRALRPRARPAWNWPCGWIAIWCCWIWFYPAKMAWKSSAR